MKIARGKRGTSAALGKSEQNEGGIVGPLTQGGSRCAPLPWATIFLPCGAPEGDTEAPPLCGEPRTSN
jgi:hypothetical protein